MHNNCYHPEAGERTNVTMLGSNHSSNSSNSDSGIFDCDSNDSDIISNDYNSMSDDDYDKEPFDVNAMAFKRCILNFCKGGYDLAIQVLLDNFATANNGITNNCYGIHVDPADRPADWDTVEDIAHMMYLKYQLQKLTSDIVAGASKSNNNLSLDLYLTLQ